MIEGQRWQIVDREPTHISCIARCPHLQALGVQQGKVDHCYHTCTWVTIWITKGIQLLHVDILYPRLLLKFALSSCLQRLINIHEPTGDSPHALIRPRTALNQQDLQVTLTQTHYHYIYRY